MMDAALKAFHDQYDSHPEIDPAVIKAVYSVAITAERKLKRAIIGAKVHK